VAPCRKRLISIQSGRIARNNRVFRLIKKLAIIFVRRVTQRDAANSRREDPIFSSRTASTTMTDASLIERLVWKFRSLKENALVHLDAVHLLYKILPGDASLNKYYQVLF